MMDLHPVGIFMLSCTCLLLCAAAPVRADISREAQALVNWKASLAGGHRSLRSWSLVNSTNLCKWKSITCNLAGHIKELDIYSANLNGTLDEFDFSAFPYLKRLSLVDIGLNGTIPASIGNLTSLVKLDISNKGLNGTIPASIGNLTSLVKLDISNNPSLRGVIPRSIGQLKHLGSLYLEHLGLNGTLPEEIGNLTCLEVLHLHSATLTGSIPLAIGRLVKLTVLNLGDNHLTGSIPLEIGNMTKLYSMYIPDNYLEGQLPGTISHLRFLDLSGNLIGGQIIPDFGNRSRMVLINIAHNNFSGLFPPSICVRGALHYVIARYNGFTGFHQQTFQNCTTLEIIDFTANNITGNLRGFFGDHLRALQIMVLSQNQLYGTLLTDRGKVFICNHTSLRVVDLSNNAIHGGLSECLMPTLEVVDLSSNSFSGLVPFSRTGECSLSHLHLANNHFKGTFPLGLRKCKSLITLDLGGNFFSGTIPFWISKSLPELRFLRLSSNMFEGIIPLQILHFPRLQLLDLSKNKLTGPVPDDFTNFTGMIHRERKKFTVYYDVLYWYTEQIEIVSKNVGRVYIMKKAGMMGIDLSCNFLSQWIPGGLTTLRGLRYLNLSVNHLSGCIPKDIGKLVWLESLDLSRNQLSGEIPPSFAGLKSISALNLSNNGLSGRIPTSNQLQTLVDPSIYSNNPGLCGFPLEDCVNSSTSTQSVTSQGEEMETLLFCCFVVAGFIFGFWLYWGMFFFRSETWRCAFYQYVDNMQEKLNKKVYSCLSCFKANEEVYREELK